MIKTDFMVLNITNRNFKMYSGLGYECVLGSACSISFDHLPGKTPIDCKCDECGALYTVTKGRLNSTNSKYCKLHRWEKYSETMKTYWSSSEGLECRKNKGKKISENRKGKGLLSDEARQAKADYKGYRELVLCAHRKWQANIEQLPNFSKTGRCGSPGAYQLDHIISKRFGYDNNISPEIIGHIANLRMIPWEQNNEKNCSCDMSIDQLLNLIQLYEDA